MKKKIYNTATIGDNFVGNSVLVIMDKKIGGVNKRHEKSFFGGIEIESVDDLTTFTGDADEINKKGIDWEIWRQILCIKLPGNSKENVLNVIRRLERIEGIKYVGPDYFYLPDATIPDDPYYSYGQWGLSGTYGIQAEAAAWDITTGSNNVRVGIIDSGIEKHPDLIANLESGKDFVNNNYITNDDPNSHGTHVAGIVGAVGNNGVGISSVCWNVTLVPLQVVFFDPYEKDWYFLYSAIIDAIGYAANSHIPILNHSGGGPTYNAALEQAIRQYPGLFVCSAGNDNADNDRGATPHYPSNYRLSNLISVGALRSNGTRWVSTPTSGSNYGANTVDLFAPGYSIYSTFKDYGYRYWDGTSMAAPFVTGVAALIKSLHPEMTAEGIKIAILGNVDVSPELNGLCVTGGRLNASKAVRHIPIVGSMDITFDGTGLYTTQGTAVGQIVLAKFHVFANGTFAIAERGKWSYPIANYTIDDSHLRFGPAASAILGYMTYYNLSYIGRDGVYFYAPCSGPYLNYSYLPLYIGINSSGATIQYSGNRYYPGDNISSTDKRRISIIPNY